MSMTQRKHSPAWSILKPSLISLSFFLCVINSDGIGGGEGEKGVRG